MVEREALEVVESLNVLEDANNEEQTSDNENTTAGVEFKNGDQAADDSEDAGAAGPDGTEEADQDEGGDEGSGSEEEEENKLDSAFKALSENELEEQKDEEDEEYNEDTAHIAGDILEIILKDMGQIIHKVTSLDSVVLMELKETEDRVQVLAEVLSEKKKEIKELRERKPISFSGVAKIETKQLEIQEMIEEFQELTTKMKKLLDISLRPSTLPIAEALPVLCSLCNKESCICLTADPQSSPQHICSCEEEVCKCYEPQSYTPGQWLEQQVMDLFPLQYEKPVCVCGSTPLVCVCKSKEDVKECVCKKEDLKEFNMIVDVMPKVVVCAPDISLPRIIVCEPYIPKKPASKKVHVCEKNRACKLYKYPGF